MQFTEAVQARFLDAVANGMYLGEAARSVGLRADLPSRYVRTDPTFAAALADAKALGKKRRVEDAPHNEARYNNHGCRCTTCRRAATTARAGRRAQEPTEPEPEADILDLNRQSPTSFSLPSPSSARAHQAA
ncbi:hypothetical protein ACF06X_33485 [Streptomyces sp. NPDC015346]|uniref:hypothetical protein n=1 Tax=Streptomyces sp. NPDC015346 TaxID=3364954 RepID=UPI0036FCE9ED